jgi:hypothetical protein
MSSPSIRRFFRIRHKGFLTLNFCCACLYFSFLLGTLPCGLTIIIPVSPKRRKSKKKLCSYLRKNLLFFYSHSYWYLELICITWRMFTLSIVKESCKFTYPVFTKIQIKKKQIFSDSRKYKNLNIKNVEIGTNFCSSEDAAKCRLFRRAGCGPRCRGHSTPQLLWKSHRSHHWQEGGATFVFNFETSAF